MYIVIKNRDREDYLTCQLGEFVKDGKPTHNAVYVLQEDKDGILKAYDIMKLLETFRESVDARLSATTDRGRLSYALEEFEVDASISLPRRAQSS